MKFDVYGRKIEVVRRQEHWRVLISGNEGKKRLAEEIMIPPDTPAEELATCLADLCHEWAREGYSTVTRLD